MVCTINLFQNFAPLKKIPIYDYFLGGYSQWLNSLGECIVIFEMLSVMLT